jgi:thiol-disulfide isomerase/thioredoxin
MTTDFPTEKNANRQEVAKLLPGAIPTDLPLQEQLDRVTQASAKHLPEEMAKLLKSYLEYLVTSGLTENALKENELAPDFALPDATCQRVTLSQLLEQGPVVLVFYRGTWCPYCNLELRAYQKVLPEFKALGQQWSPSLPCCQTGASGRWKSNT